MGPLDKSKNFGLHSTCERKTLRSWGQAERSVDLHFKRILSLFFHLPKPLSPQSPHLPAFTRTWVKLKMCFTHSWGIRILRDGIDWVTLELVLIPPKKIIWGFSKEIEVRTSDFTLMEDLGHNYKQGFIHALFPLFHSLIQQMYTECPSGAINMLSTGDQPRVRQKSFYAHSTFSSLTSIWLEGLLFFQDQSSYIYSPSFRKDCLQQCIILGHPATWTLKWSCICQASIFITMKCLDL